MRAVTPTLRRIFLLGFLAGFTLAIESSCSPISGACSGCPGCCDASGTCMSGTADTACGSAGAACVACAGGSTCTAAGFCTGGSGGGAGGGTGGTGGTGGSIGGGTGGSGTTLLSGRVTYDFVPSVYDPVSKTGGLMFNQAVEKPVRNAVVRLVQGTTTLAEALTDESGNYSLRYTPGSAQVTVIALARTQTPVIVVQDNTDNNAVWAFGKNLAAGATTADLHATHGWQGSSYDPNTRLAAPFAVLDSMYIAAHRFMDVRSVAFPDLRVNWSPNNVPQSGDKTQGFIGTSHFSPQENMIYILGKDGVDTDEFDSHVIVHEWGHYFEKNLSRSDSPGGPHSGGEILDPRITFGEGWGNALASMLLPESVYADTSWNASGPYVFGFDAETEPTPTDDPNPGPFSESSVFRLLYHVYDTANHQPYDSVGTGLGPIYDVMTGFEKTTQAMTTVGSFITGLKQQASVNGAAVDTLLAHYNIGPITSSFGAGDINLAGMYTDASVLPFSGSIALGGGNPANSYQQNQYYVFNGTGGQVTVSANSTYDVAIAAYLRGVVQGSADNTTSGTETFSFNTQSGVTYVVVLTGYGNVSGDYTVTVNITSP